MQVVRLRCFLAVTLLASAIAWEAEWIHGVQPTNQDKFMDLKALQDLRTAVKGEFTKKPHPWYTLADLADPRFEPLCSLKIMHAKAGEWKLNYCSCSFVKPNMVATAAHCLTVPKVTPKSEHAIWVQQLYGKGNDPSIGKYPVNLVTEWWYPSAFLSGGQMMHDVALLRTKQSGSKAYQMMKPLGLDEGYNLVTEEVLMIGYPKDAAVSEVAVISSGIFMTLDREKTVIENVYPYEAGKTSGHPMMQSGGSGGPIIVSEAMMAKYRAQAEALKKKDPTRAEDCAKAADTIKMGLFGVVGIARTAEPFNANASLEFTDKLLKAVNLIYSDGTKGATVEKRANGDELVKLKGI